MFIPWRHTCSVDVEVIIAFKKYTATCALVSSYYWLCRSVWNTLIILLNTLLSQYSVKRILYSFKFINPIRGVTEINNDGQLMFEEFCGLFSDDVWRVICVLGIDGAYCVKIWKPSLLLTVGINVFHKWMMVKLFSVE